MFEVIFIVFAGLFFLGLLIGKFFVFNKRNPKIISRYVASLAGIMLWYCISAVILMYQTNVLNKFVLMLFMLSPFIIGKVATYRTLNFYTDLQISIVVLSAFYAKYFL